MAMLYSLARRRGTRGGIRRGIRGGIKGGIRASRTTTLVPIIPAQEGMTILTPAPFSVLTKSLYPLNRGYILRRIPLVLIFII